MEVAETNSQELIDAMEQDTSKNEVSYSIVQYEKRWAIKIESGVFNEFVYTIENMRLTYKDENEDEGSQVKLVYDINDVADKDVNLDFEYELRTIPASYIDEEGRQSYFENISRHILIDILLNYPNLYKLEKQQEQQDSGE